MPIRKSRISGGSAPSGTTADRPANPSVGDTFFNGTLGVQEIYTSTGWLPATGANDFNVVLNGEDTSVTLDKEYFAGAYTITSALSDNSFDIYIFDTQGSAAGYTNSPSINATSNFNKIVVLGGQNGDLLSFSYKTTFTTASITDEVTSGPVIKSISVADLPNIDDTTVITGINFAEDVQVTFTGTNQVALSPKSIVRSSATSLVVTRPDDLIEDHSPYTVTVTNPGITAPSGTNGHISTNAITAGGDPVWVTASGKLTSGTFQQAYSTTIQATDPDGGTITYSIASGLLPAGLSLNSSTGEISGTISASGASFVIAATDSGDNITNRAFEIVVPPTATGGTVTEESGLKYHTFTSNGTFEFVSGNITDADILIVGGGGAGGGYYYAGGGGAGGYISLTSQAFSTPQSYTITVGAGAAAVGSNQARGQNGTDTTAFGMTAAGGGGGGYNDSRDGLNGGSGGGAGGAQSGSGTGGQPVNSLYGNRGGNTSNVNFGGYGGGTGGGGASSAGEDISGNVDGGNGGSGATWVNGSVYAAGGGGGGGNNGGGDGGNGGSAIGGRGASARGINSTAGTVNTGSGGGGGSHTVYGAGAGSGGGSGIVIIRYPI
jgi:hypothetical protein